MACSLREKPGMHSYFLISPACNLRCQWNTAHSPQDLCSVHCRLSTGWAERGGRSLRRGDGNQPRLHASLERSSKEFHGKCMDPKNIKKGIMECAYHETLHLISKFLLIIDWLLCARCSARFFLCYIKISHLHRHTLTHTKQQQQKKTTTK